MKILVWIFGIVVVLFTIIYVFLFTPSGNSLVKPYIEKQVQNITHMDSKLLKFKLSINDFEIFLQINTKNTLHLYGNYSLVNQAFNMNYVVDFKELSSLQDLLQKRLIGRNYSHGNVVGDIHDMTIRGKSRIFDGDTSYTLQLKDLELDAVQMNLINFDLSTLMLAFNIESYIQAKVDMDFNLRDIKKKNYAGVVHIKTKNARFNRKLVKKNLGLDIPQANTFIFSSESIIDGDTVKSALKYKSSLLELATKKSHYNFSTKKLQSDFNLKIPNLNAIYFLTKHRIKGGISFNGNLAYQKELNLHMHSKIADGKADVTIKGHRLHIDAYSLNTLKLLDKVYYPQILSASLDAQLNYDLLKATGYLKSKLKNATFSKNKLFKLLKKYAHLNLYQEKFRGTLDANIEQENILIDMDLFSQKSSIDIKKAKLNTRIKKVDALLSLETNSHELDISLQGSVSQPDIAIQINNTMVKNLFNKYLK